MASFECCAECHWQCSCCGEDIPPDGCPVSEWGFVLGAGLNTTSDQVDAFAAAFDVEDPSQDFVICWECLQAYGGPDDQHGDPLGWLENYLEEEGRLISREEALRRLGG
jgi:hypothetical protein